MAQILVRVRYLVFCSEILPLVFITCVSLKMTSWMLSPKSAVQLPPAIERHYPLHQRLGLLEDVLGLSVVWEAAIPPQLLEEALRLLQCPLPDHLDVSFSLVIQGVYFKKLCRRILSRVL